MHEKRAFAPPRAEAGEPFNLTRSTVTSGATPDIATAYYRIQMAYGMSDARPQRALLLLGGTLVLLLFADRRLPGILPQVHDQTGPRLLLVPLEACQEREIQLVVGLCMACQKFVLEDSNGKVLGHYAPSS